MGQYHNAEATLFRFGKVNPESLKSFLYPFYLRMKDRQPQSTEWIRKAADQAYHACLLAEPPQTEDNGIVMMEWLPEPEPGTLMLMDRGTFF